MNIAIISTLTAAPWGGSEELWADMATVALADKHRVALFRKKWEREVPRIRSLSERGLLTQSLPALSLPWQTNRLKQLWQKLFSPVQSIVDFRPDVVCVSQSGTYDVVAFTNLTTFLQTLSVPYVLVSQHNNDAHILDQSSRELASALFERAYCVAFVAESNRRASQRQLAQAVRNSCILKNPVNLDSVTAVAWPEYAPVRMACVARLQCAFKGQDLLLELLGESEWADKQWLLNLYGDGPDRQYLEALARYYSITDRVHFHGHITDIRAVWRDNHLLLLPSRSEGTPLALMEAMLCARPAVVTDVGGNAEMIQDGVTGFVAHSTTTRSLDLALKRAWAARADWQSMGLKAKAVADISYEKDPGRRLLELLSKAVEVARHNGRS